eukprot:gnl/TRDRNA2_/TRDRNA2_153388_c2_seq1.p1 gnl/TRDRNA2_/TRDRNA2_153388_c2~~gnl/TRDRNA2_/TRDRNA2_153388_c2_seq1.p1  ORF type:complete len:156 (+),score=30.00 gnl/TRDRNA2_/TRDRNA2_153388_c2_seq1:57-524(+)
MGMGEHPTWLPDGKITQEAVNQHIKSMSNSANISMKIVPSTHEAGSPDQIMVHLGNVSLAVTRPHSQHGADWQFMNMAVQGLESTGYPIEDISGVLGTEVPGKKKKSDHQCFSLASKHPKARSFPLALAAQASPATILEVGIDSDADADALLALH